MASDVSDLTAQLPRELRARIGSLDDLERVVEFQNRFASPGRWMSPATVRRAAADNPEPKRLMLVVEDGSGALQAHGNVSDGGMWASPDGSWRLNLRVAAPWRRRGVGRALLARLEAHAGDGAAKRIVAAVQGDEPEGSRFAEAMGYRAYHERIDAYLEVPRFDPGAFEDPNAIAARAGVGLASYAELVTRLGDRLEDFQRGLLTLQWEVSHDVPSPTPMPAAPPPFEQVKKMFFEGPFLDPATTIIALRDERPVGLTVTMVKENGAAYTNFTGVSRTERGKGIALALKLRALRELKRLGVRLYGTTNDETNAAMRGINRRLGYTPEPPTIMVEKRLV